MAGVAVKLHYRSLSKLPYRFDLYTAEHRDFAPHGAVEVAVQARVVHSGAHYRGLLKLPYRFELHTAEHRVAEAGEAVSAGEESTEVKRSTERRRGEGCTPTPPSTHPTGSTTLTA